MQVITEKESGRKKITSQKKKKKKKRKDKLNYFGS